MEREIQAEAHQESLSASPSTPLNWPLGLTLALTIGLAWPAVTTWLALLSQRPLGENVPQLLTVGFLIFAFTKQDQPELPPMNPSIPGFMALVLTGFLYILGLWLSVKVVIFTGLLALLVALCWACWGGKFLYRLLPGFLFALFLLPQFPTDIRTAISLPLQLISTQLATALAGLFIPIKTMGNIFYIKGEAFEVTAACSGLNTWVGYVFAGMLGILMGRFSLGRLGRLLIGAPILALAENALRLWITALVAYWVSPNTGMAIHTNIEFILFPLGLFIMVLAERQIERRFPLTPACTEPAPQPEAPAKTDAPEASIKHEENTALPAPEEITPAQPEQNTPIISKALSPCQAASGLIWATLGLLLLINLGVWSGAGQTGTADSPTASLPPIPYQVGAWHGQDLPLRPTDVAILAPAALTTRAYSIGSPQAGQPFLWLNLIEARSMNHLHNMVDSLIASGTKPKLLGTIVMQTRKGPLKASWFRCLQADGQPFNLLLWYEWQGGSAENRWVWYWNVLTLKLQKKQPTWRLVEIAAPGSPMDNGPEQSRRLEQLKAFATDFYPATVP